MNGSDLSKELKSDIELNQTQLKAAICNHQNLLARLKSDSYNTDLQKEISKTEEEIISRGIEQKNLLARLRDEYKAYEKSLKTNLIKNGLGESRFNLTNALTRARKQNIVVRSTPPNSYSDDSGENSSLQSSPEEPSNHPTHPHDLSQAEYLGYFNLVTPDVFKEMQKKRVERKRRSTANPQFLYGNKGWDILTNNKRKRNTLLMSSISPPHTRQSVKKKQERTSPPLPTSTPSTSMSVTSTPTGPSKSPKIETNGSIIGNKVQFNSFPVIPNLPSGLIIERVSPSSSLSSDSKCCITCKKPGVLSTCEVCNNGFHISCHNRPLIQTPRHCPKCIGKETRTVGSLNVPSGMTVSYISSAELTEKLKEKQQLEEVKHHLSAELTQLQDRHSQLTISLKEQKMQQDHLYNTQQSTQDKIKQILTFVEKMQNPIRFDVDAGASSSSVPIVISSPSP